MSHTAGLPLHSQFFYSDRTYAPPDMGELRKRLEGRHTESPEAVKMRLARAEREMGQKDSYDAIVVNTTVERAADEILALARARKLLG